MRKIFLALFAMLILQDFEIAPAAQQAGKRIKLFDGASLKGWNGNPTFWSVEDGAIHGATNETRGELLLTDGDYGDFRLILKSRLVSESNHLGVCFWGERRADFRYGDCVLVIPPHGGMWDYRPGKGSPPRENIPHTKADPHQWHVTEVLGNMKEGTLRMAVNGVEIVRYKDEDPARLKRGPIGLQIHSGASIVEYKDLEVEIDPKDNRLITVK
jgi:3-keto-disaccharide hydrolase